MLKIAHAGYVDPTSAKGISMGFGKPPKKTSEVKSPPPEPPAPPAAPIGNGPSQSSAPEVKRDNGELIEKTAVGESKRRRRTAVETLLGLSGPDKKTTILGD